MATLRDLQLALKETLEDLRERDQIIDELELDLDEKEAVIQQLQSELEKLTVQASEFEAEQSSSNNNVTVPYMRRHGVSAEPVDKIRGKEFTLKKFSKSQRSKELIRQAIDENDFMSKLETMQVREIVDCMYMVDFKKHSFIIREGEPGLCLYAIEDGKVEVTKEGRRLCVLGPAKIFGELAILYNCKRSVTVRGVIVGRKNFPSSLCVVATTACQLWAIDRPTFQGIMMKTGLIKHTEYTEFLSNVPLFRNFPDESIGKIADVLNENHYENGEHIVRQGAKGDTFYIISRGRVKETKNLPGSSEEQYLKTMYTGDFFGEKALDRAYKSLLSMEHVHRIYGDEGSVEDQFYQRISESLSFNIRSELNSLRLSDLTIVGTLGLGGFARVELVQISQDAKKAFALKQMSKHHIVESRQEEHIMNEKKIMMDCNSPFVCKLYRTFKDRKYVYMLLEVCLGGEIWSLLKERYHPLHCDQFNWKSKCKLRNY